MKLGQLLAAMAMLVTALCFAGTARAATCDQVVGDDAGLFGSSGDSVAAAAQRLAAQGAFVRVRTTASLATYEDIPGMIRPCQSWKSGSAARSDLLVFVLYRDPATNKGKANVYAGSRFQNRLNAQWQGIKTSQIGPRFNVGDYSGAAVGGLNGISGALGGSPVAVQPPAPTQVAPRPAPIPVVPVPAPVPAPTVVTPAPSSGGSSAGLWVFLGILVLAGGGIAFFFVRRSKAEAKAAQQNAKNKATSCATEIEAFSPTAMTVLEAKVTAASKGCSPDDARSLTALLNALKTRSAEATKQYGRLSQSSNPDDDGKSVQEYESIEKSYDKLLNGLDDAKRSQTALDNKLGEIKRAADQAKPALEKLGKDIEAAAADIAEVQKAGFKTGDLESALAEAIADQETATAAIGEGRAAAATTTCSSGSVKAKKAGADAKGLVSRKQAIEARIARVKASIASTAADIETGKKDFAAIQSGFVSTSWESVRNNVANAASGAESATQSCDAATKSVGMEQQDWKGAEQFLGDAEERLAKAAGYLTALTATRQRLQAAKAETPAKLASARAAVAEANRFIAANAADIEDVLEGNLLQQLRDAEAKLPAEETVRRTTKPDYLALVSAAEVATKVAADVLQSARGDAAHNVQMRAQAAAAVESAAERRRIDEEAARQRAAVDASIAFAGGVAVGAAIGSRNNGNDNSSLGYPQQSRGGLMGGDDSLDGGTDDSSSYTSPSSDLDSGGGGLMGGSDDLGSSDDSSGGGNDGSNDDL